MQQIENAQAFHITILQATNTKSIRIKVTDKRFNQSAIIPFGDGSLKENAVFYLSNLGYVLLNYCEFGQSEGIITSSHFKDKYCCFRSLSSAVEELKVQSIINKF